MFLNSFKYVCVISHGSVEKVKTGAILKKKLNLNFC